MIEKVENVEIVEHVRDVSWNYFEMLPEELIIDIIDRLSSIDRQKLRNLDGNIKAIISSPYYQERLWLECFHSKMNYTECRLGYPINVKFEYTGLLMKQCKTTFDILSYECYNELDVNSTVWNEKFTFWLPLYINHIHWRKSSKILIKQVNNYMCYNSRQYYDKYDFKHESVELENMIGREDKYTTYQLKFGKQYNPNNNIHDVGQICHNTELKANPYYIVDIYTTFMTNIIVEIMKGEVHLSLKVLEGFCQIYRTFYQLSEEYPKIKTIIDEKIKNFIKKPQHRHKTYTPNLGNMLMMLTISDQYSWKDIRKHYLEESGDRNIMWILKKYPYVSNIDDPKKILEQSHIVDEDDPEEETLERWKESLLPKIFKLTSVGKKLLLFNLHFINKVIGDDKDKFIRTLDCNYGYPTNEMKENFQNDINDINNVNSYSEFYKYLDLYKPNDEILAQKIIYSVQRSNRKGYNKGLKTGYVVGDKKDENKELNWERTT